MCDIWGMVLIPAGVEAGQSENTDCDKDMMV